MDAQKLRKGADLPIWQIDDDLNATGTPYRHTYRWSRLPQQRFTNGMVASVLCVPLVLAGIYFAR
jgi:hypothetical protein